MQRRDFVKNTAKLAIGLGIGLNLGFATVKDWYENGDRPLGLSDLADTSDNMEAGFHELLRWMKTNGWTDYFRSVLGVNLELTGRELKKELIKELDKNKLAALRQSVGSGYDDFSGEQLVQPGFPAFSLLYHTLASPRVRPDGVRAYPSLAQIDLLEDYIYALCRWDQLKSIYGIRGNDELVFAVFAYEYRPAFKTPHHAYADMVYSRTGIGRVGDEPSHYDAINRNFTNKPAQEGREKHVAVTPARFGLYLARKVSNTGISLVANEIHKGDDSKDDRNDGCKTFLQPIRKIFNDDMLVGEAPVRYEEKHAGIKLVKLAQTHGITFLHGMRPTPRYSKDLLVQDDTRHAGSSLLVISKHAPMIRPAMEHGRILFFKVPKEERTSYDNRFFTAFCTQKVEDVELLEGNEDLGRRYNHYEAPRNQPMFINITNEAEDTTKDEFHAIAKEHNDKFEEKLAEGDYYAPLFEDSLCDGHVTVHTNNLRLGHLGGIPPHCLPAFSVITAPDFFPQVDPMDLRSFDIEPGPSHESNFYEGGVASLATARIKPNPHMIDTQADSTSDTYLAVLSGSVKKETGVSPHMLAVYKDPASDRGYDISGFLPDVASSVYAPGWDVTYCSNDNTHGIYIGTEGLGSPFVEDMKFCSALNGMWPATSPDAARTYQGSNEMRFRNPTSVPLLDDEIGICGDGPAGGAHDSLGWDGEQGPYLEKVKGKWVVNFTDIGRADAVSNALDGKLDMSRLRKLRAGELINRMECLKMCIQALPQKNFHERLYKLKITGYTYLWLVSAEKVNWGREDAAALGIPANLLGRNKRWITEKENARVHGEGYLYVFANTEPTEEDDPTEDPWARPIEKPKKWAKNPKRRLLDCEQIYVCQVTNDPAAHRRIAWGEVKEGSIHWH